MQVSQTLLEALGRLDTIGLPRELAPLNTPKRRLNNLPLPLTSLIRREQEIDALTALLLRDARPVAMNSGTIVQHRRQGAMIGGVSRLSAPLHSKVANGSLQPVRIAPGSCRAMYISRLSFHTRPSHTEEVAQRLRHLADLIAQSGMRRPRVLRISMASTGAPDLQFEEEFDSLSELEQGVHRVVATPEFRQWSRETSDLLLQSPKREILTVE